MLNMEVNGFDLAHPVVLKPLVGGNYAIIDGHHCYKAAKLVAKGTFVYILCFVWVFLLASQ